MSLVGLQGFGAFVLAHQPVMVDLQLWPFDHAMRLDQPSGGRRRHPGGDRRGAEGTAPLSRGVSA